ncbi:MAG: hypothetical protein ACXW3Z_08150 [Limisphaerales bacterium]
MKCCRLLGLCLLLTTTAHGQSDTEPVPDLNSRTADGFLVKCYWVGTYKCVEKFEGQGVTDLFGQALSPVCGKATTTASIIITEEVDNSGQRRAVVRAGTWASKFTGLYYWFKNGKRVAAGPGGSGGGRIPTSGEGAPTVSLTHGPDTAGIHLGWTESDALAFDSKYLPLKLVMGGPNPLGIGPSGTHRPHLELDTKEKTERRKAHVMGMMAIEEPVQAGRNTVIQQEWGDPGSDWYAQWTMTRACEYGKVKLVTPRGDPRTAPRAPAADPCSSPAPATVDGQNEFTFTCGSPGKLEIDFKASVTPSSAINSVRDRVSFTIDPIAGSTLQWDPSNPNGKATISGGFLVAKATFTRLPLKNDDFGLKTVQLLLDGKLCEKTLVEIFFPKFGINHPGGVVGDPNWFYYWQEGQVCGIAPTDEFDGTKPQNYIAYSRPSEDSKVRLCPPVALTNQGPITYAGASPWGSVIGCGTGRGIKKVAEVLEHERKHISIYQTYHAGIVANPGTDSDKDHVPTANEATDAGVKSNPANSDTFNVATTMSFPGYKGYGDDEIRCRTNERNLTIPYYPKKDWANPGCQSKQRYGPTR